MAFELANVPSGGLTTKQDKLIGQPGQVVGFNQNGNAVAQNSVTAFKGRTGAITPQALINLGAAATAHTHGAGDITSGTLRVTRGSTGATSASQALASLGGFARTGGKE